MRMEAETATFEHEKHESFCKNYFVKTNVEGLQKYLDEFPVKMEAVTATFELELFRDNDRGRSPEVSRRISREIGGRNSYV